MTEGRTTGRTMPSGTPSRVDPEVLFIDERKVQPYAPAGHTGTSNRRLVGPEQGATNLEVLIGTIEPGQGATPHLHRRLEQFCHMLSGTAEVTIGETTRILSEGESCFFPAGTPHTFLAVGDRPVRVMVVYGPPYAEGDRIDL